MDIPRNTFQSFWFGVVIIGGKISLIRLDLPEPSVTATGKMSCFKMISDVVLFSVNIQRFLLTRNSTIKRGRCKSENLNNFLELPLSEL